MSPKEKFPLYLSPEKKATLERRHTEDGSRSITGFIENAIDFYLDYLSANNSGLFLPSAVQSYLDGRLNQMENRMASLLFKQAVAPAGNGHNHSRRCAVDQQRDAQNEGQKGQGGLNASRFCIQCPTPPSDIPVPLD